MIRHLESIDNENSIEIHKFLDQYAGVLFGTPEKSGWLLSATSEEDLISIYKLFSTKGALFRKVIRQAENKMKEFIVFVDKLPVSVHL